TLAVGSVIFMTREHLAKVELQRLNDEFAELNARVETALANMNQTSNQQTSVQGELWAVRQKIAMLDERIKESPTDKELQQDKAILVEKLTSLEQRAADLASEASRFRAELEAARQKRIQTQVAEAARTKHIQTQEKMKEKCACVTSNNDKFEIK